MASPGKESLESSQQQQRLEMLNPFKMPSDQEVFRIRDEEKRKRNMEREAQKIKHVHEKLTWSSRMQTGTTSIMSNAQKQHREDTELIAAVRRETGAATDVSQLEVHLPTVDVREKDNMAKYIEKKREMGLIRMSLATKRQEIEKLEEEAERAEKRIRQQEEQLEETNDKFEAFLKHSEMEQVEAMKKADKEAKDKAEKNQEIKRLSAQIAQLETERKKNEEQEMTCLRYKQFLDELTPPQFFTATLINILCEDKKRKMLVELEREMQDELNKAIPESDEMELRQQKLHDLEVRYQQEAELIRLQVEGTEAERARQLEAQEAAAATGGSTATAPPVQISNIDKSYPGMTLKDVHSTLAQVDLDRIPMYFDVPKKILEQFVEIEEGNLFLINTCQEREEEIEEINQKYQQENQEMIQIAQSRRVQMDIELQKIQQEQAKMKQLEERISRSKEGGSGLTEEELKERVEQKVKDIFRKIGEDTNIVTLGMLTQIEMKLEELHSYITNPASGIDAAFVAKIMKDSDKDRRSKARQVALAKQREDRERRSRIAIERSKAPVKKRVGKPVMWRSRPPDMKKEEGKQQVEVKVDEDEEFFQ